MRPRYSFSSRRTRKIDKIRKQRTGYPKLLEQVLDTADIILEVVDARFINETRNKDLEKDIKKRKKQLIYVINKSDLTKTTITKLSPYVLVTCKDKKGIKELRDKIKELSKKVKKPAVKFDKIVVGVIGYPNTGKSSLINLLIGKSSAGVGSDAGFTRGLQKLRLTKEITLLDSPGVIPKKEYTSSGTKEIAKHTMVGARSYSQIKEPDMVVASLMQEFPGVLEAFYKVDSGDSEKLIEELGQRWRLFKKKGIVDEDKVARRVLKDWQSGEIKT